MSSLFLCELVFLLNDVSSLLVAVHGLSAECGRLCWPGFVPCCLRALPRSGGAFLLSYPNLLLQALLAPFLRLPVLVVWSFSRSVTTFSQARRLDICDTSPGDCAAVCSRSASLHLGELSCGLLEVGLRHVLDLAASHRLGHLYLSWHV